MARYGRYATSESDTGIINAGSERGSVFAPISGNGWATAINALVWKSSGVPGCRLVIRTTSGGSPSARKAYTAQFTPGATGMSGAMETRAIAASTDSPISTSEMLFDGTVYYVGALAITSGALGHGMLAGGSPYNGNFYTDFGLGSTPPSTFSVEAVSFEGVHTFSIEYQPNRIPTCTMFAPTGSSSDLTPTLWAHFDDDDEAYGDYPKQHQFQVQRNVSGTWTYVWQPAVDGTNDEEQASHDVGQVYAGTALIPGQSYRARCRVSDAFGEWSAYSDWLTFTVNSGGTVTQGAAPAGKQEAITGLTFGPNTYTHASGLSMTHAQIRLKQGNTVVFTSALIAKAVAPGGTFSITQAEAGITLQWGNTYTWQTAVKDSAGLLTDFNDALPVRTFNTNAAPAIPTIAQPVTGSPPSQALPLIVADVTDTDDTQLTGLALNVRVKGPYVHLNPGFEVDATNWTKTQTAGVTASAVARSTAQFNTGIGSGQLQITANTGGIGSSATAWPSDLQPCIPGVSYTVRAALRTDNANLTPRLAIRWYDASSVFLSGSTEVDYTATANTWSSRSFTAIAPANAVKMSVSAVAYSKTSNQIGSIFVDDVAIDDNVRYERAMVYASLVSTNKYRFNYQTVAADMPAFGTYKFDVSAFDGTLYSGTKTTAATRLWSAERSYVYAAGPTIAITAPTDSQVLTTHIPTITWTVTGSTQASAVVSIYLAGADTPLHTANIAGATASYAVPAGVLRNGLSYDLIITVTNTLAITGSTPRRPFSVVLPPLDVVPGFSVAGTALDGDGGTPTAILVAWSASTYDISVFQRFLLRRRLATEPEDQAVVIADLSIDRTSYLDVHVASGKTYVYSLSQEVLQAGEPTESDPTAAEAVVSFRFIVLAAKKSGDTYRVVFRAFDDPKVDPVNPGSEVWPWGAQYPTMQYGTEDADRIAFTGELYDDPTIGVTAQDAYDAARTLVRLKDVVIYRDHRGDVKSGSLFIAWSKASGGSYIGQVELKETL